jgi:20S proteasome alpha/beta subunit
MTVCLAAFADYPKAIVCIADKGISYGDHIQWDSDGTKIATISSKGTTIMFSGGEEATARVLSRLVAREEEIGDDVGVTIKICEEEYSGATQELIEAKFLRPNLLSRPEYLSAVTSTSLNDHILSIAKEVKEFTLDCSFLLCGFDAKNQPFVLDLEPPGIVTNLFSTGFHAIGSGWDKAVARLLFSEHKRTNPIHRAVYDLFDAKANAEMSAGVGYEWDVKVLHAGRIIFDFTDGPKKLIEKVWAKYNRSPFDKRGKDDLGAPPRDWKQVFQDISNDIAAVAATAPQDTTKGWPKARSFKSSLANEKG